MFTDLVGSSALSTRLDPEDLRAVIGAYHKCVAETVARFNGFVAKYMGDGVLVYFGYPQAHEDDAERAVRAELRARRSGWQAGQRRAAPNPHWSWNRCSGGRRSGGLRGSPGARCCRRDAEHGGASAGRGSAGHHCH